MSGGIDDVRNLGLACHTLALSHELRKVSNDFPRSSRQIQGYSKRLQLTSEGIFFLSSAVTRDFLEDEDEDESFVDFLLDVQKILHKCHQFVKVVDNFCGVLKICGNGIRRTPYLIIRNRSLNALGLDATEFIEETLLNLEVLVLNCTKFLAKTNPSSICLFESFESFESSRANLWDQEIRAYVVVSAIGSRIQIKLPVLCPGPVVMAVQEPPVLEAITKDGGPLLPDVDTLTCLVFKSRKDRHEMELKPDIYQPTHFIQKGINQSKRDFLQPLQENIPLEGQFVAQLDFGRPKRRRFILSKEHISISREKPDAKPLDTKLCHRKSVILVAFHPSSEAKVSKLIGFITFFWKKGSGKTSALAAATVHFTEVDDLKIWATSIAHMSKCNKILNSSGYMDGRWSSRDDEKSQDNQDAWSTQAQFATTLPSGKQDTSAFEI